MSKERELRKDYAYRMLLERLGAITDDNARLSSEPVLSKELGVSRSTLREALQRLEKEGYITRSHYYGTRAVSSSRCNHILLLHTLRMNDMNFQYVVCSTIIQAASQHGYRCNTVDVRKIPTAEEISRLYCGVILLGASYSEKDNAVKILQKCNIPIVYWCEDYENHLKELFHSVGTDNRVAWLAGLEYFVQCGYRRIMTLLSASDERNLERLGWRSATLATELIQRGWDEAARSIICLDDTNLDFEEEAAMHIRKLSPEAILCYSDLEATLIYRVLANLGKKIPGDVAVLGMDGLPVWARNTSPTLGSIAFPFHQCAQAAFWLIIHHASFNTPRHLIFPSMLHSGSSIQMGNFENLANLKQ